MGRVVYGDEFYQEVFDELERDLVGSVGNGVGGIRVHFHEKSVDAGGHGRAGEDRGELAVAAGGAADLLVEQVTGMVRWRESVKTLLPQVAGISDPGKPATTSSLTNLPFTSPTLGTLFG